MVKTKKKHEISFEDLDREPSIDSNEQCNARIKDDRRGRINEMIPLGFKR